MGVTRRHFTGGIVTGLSLVGAGASALASMPEGRASDSLKAIARRRGLRFGSAVSDAAIADEDARTLILRECEVLTAENQLKWRALEPQSGQWDFGPADRFVQFAHENRLSMRGHCFVWANDRNLPGWVLEQEADYGANGGRALEAAMRDLAERLHGHAGQVRSWDVVNEAVLPEDGTLRDTLFTRALGERHIDLAFHIMRERFPKARLVYNDSMTWGQQEAHRTGVLRLLERALSRGVPIDALGIESHLGKALRAPVQELQWYAFLREVQGMGLSVSITELDCSDLAIADSDPAYRDGRVADFVRRYLDLTLAFPNVEDVVVWSLADSLGYMNRWSYPDHRRRADGLPLRGYTYDDQLQPKPMREAIAAAMAAAPRRRRKG